MRAMSIHLPRSASRLGERLRPIALSLALAMAVGVQPARGAPAPAASIPTDAAAATWQHGWAVFGAPKYPRGFAHFDYADPQAKRGGTLYLSNPDRRTSFDKFNPWTIKGQSPGGVQLFMFETLAIVSGDEPATMYGLLAEEILVAPDRSSISFRLNPKARFLNGDPVLAGDVKHSYEQLVSKYASPAYRTAFGAVERVVLVDERTVRFELKEKERSADAITSIGTSLPIFSHKWGIGPDGKPKNLDEIITEYPITSGPYSISLVDSGRRIEFSYRADYWARDLGVRRGFFNFDRIVYRYYKDRAVGMEAFKAGEFDITLEYSARRYARQHDGVKWRDGRIKKEVLPTKMGQGMQPYLPNLRRPIFADRRTREALDLAYDFDWVNRYRQYKRNDSVFSNSEFAAKGLPGLGELKLLEPFRDKLPPEVFGPAYVPPRTDSAEAIRANLRRGTELLAAAGWKLGADGVMVNAKGERLEFEYLTSEDGAARTVAVWQKNLEKLGIKMRVRQVDFALFRKRLEVFDYDMVAILGADFMLPSPIEYVETFGSKAADEPGSNNFRGLKDPVVDALLSKMSAAHTMQDLIDTCRAFDRVVMHQHWQVPELFISDWRISYWDRFERPKTMPLYYTIDSPNEQLPAWPIMTWWLKDGARR
jgi:microcin C transport system substrate-binding protein